MTRRIAVCVPVRNEAQRLPGLLDALERQALEPLEPQAIEPLQSQAFELPRREGHPAFTLCLLFDGCTDGSVAVVAARTLPFAVRCDTLPLQPANAGRARRAAMALGQSTGADVLLSTDADSQPRPDWIALTLCALATADVVAGRIVRQGAAVPVQDRLEAYYDRLFALRRRIDPVPWEATTTHHYASGASLGFRTEAYRAIGGFEPVANGEDGRIVDAAHRAGQRVRRDASVVVETSSRRHGRACGGLADHLRALDRGGDQPGMAHPADCAWRWERQAAARAAFGGDLRALAAGIGRSAVDIAAAAADAPNAEAFSTRVVPDVPGGERMVALDVAERALATLEQRFAIETKAQAA